MAPTKKHHFSLGTCVGLFFSFWVSCGFTEFYLSFCWDITWFHPISPWKSSTTRPLHFQSLEGQSCFSSQKTRFKAPMSPWKKGAVGCSLGLQKGDEILPRGLFRGFLGFFWWGIFFLGIFYPDSWGFMIQFDLCICLKMGGSSITQFFGYFGWKKSGPIRKKLKMHF